MPIVPKNRVKVAAAAPVPAIPDSPPRSRFRIKVKVPSPQAVEAPAAEERDDSVLAAETKSPPLSGSEKIRDERQTKKDYKVGYGRPPVETRFDGSRPGPGRPRGAVSQDTLMKKHFSHAERVAVEGKLIKIQARELAIMLRKKAAMSGDRHAIDYVLKHSDRLFAEPEATAGGARGNVSIDMDAHDKAILAALQAMLLSLSDELPTPIDPSPGERP